MKKIILAAIFATVAFASCSKKDDNKTVTPTTPGQIPAGTKVAIVSASKNADSTLTLDIKYTSANTIAYDYDVAYLSINDTATLSVPVDHHDANTSFVYKISIPKYTGTKYHICVIRKPSNDTVGTYTGN